MTHEPTQADIRFAVESAQAAFETDPFGSTGDAERSDWLMALAEALADDRHQLVAIADGETHLGQDRLYGELLRTVRQLEMCAEIARSGSWLDPVIDTAIDLPPPYGRPDIRRINVPLGPVAVFAASNFPFAFSVLGNDTASALAVGCPVVLKSHPGHPATSERVASLAQNVLPAGALTVLYGMGYEANLALVSAPEIRGVGFTGSTAGGRALLDAINARLDPIPFFGELGAVNPVVVGSVAARTRGRDLGQLLATGATMSMGQFCTNPGVIFLPSGAEEIDQAFRAGVAAAPRHALLNTRIDAGFKSNSDALSKTRGVSCDDIDGHRVFSISASDFATQATAREEVFGPATLIVAYDSETDLVTAIDTLEGSLTASLHMEAEDAALMDRIERKLQRIAGRILYAGVSPGVALTDAMVHGGPWPSSTRADTSSVGPLSLGRWTRPVAYQSCPASRLPRGLDDDNSANLMRRVNGTSTRGAVSEHPPDHRSDNGRMASWRSKK